MCYPPAPPPFSWKSIHAQPDVHVDLRALDVDLRKRRHAGVRGVRFNFVKRLVDALPFDSLSSIAERIKPLGWHIVIYFEAQELPELYDFFTALPTTVVVDHMGRPDVSKPVDGPEFELFVKLRIAGSCSRVAEGLGIDFLPCYFCDFPIRLCNAIYTA